ncbi:autotransporter outer membrane beta-barrel domain-containing protein [Pseudomonas sp. NFXW11]|uniref:autotransporter family protein n=1 Tax=Pseudomonas sp. NFXW11 TaxID=2819531 RepID=UPI003CE8B6E7
MKRAFRIICSHARQAFMVTDELTATGGKRSHSRLLLAAAGSGCLVLANPGMAQAQERCNTIEVEISDNGGGNDTCTLHSSGQGSVEVNATLLNNSDAITAPRGFIRITNNAYVIGSGTGNGINLSGNFRGFALLNQESSSIQGGINGVVLANGYYLSSLTNAGEITSGNINGTGIAIDNASIGVLHNLATGNIYNSASGNAIKLVNNASINGNLINDGRIASNGGGAAIYGDAGKITSDLLNDGQISNQGSNEHSAIELSGFTIGGNFSNASQGVIDGSAGAIRLTGSSIGGTLTNQGTLNGRGDTASVLLEQSSVDSLVNSGILQGKLTGLQLDGSTLGSITNDSAAVLKGGDNGLTIGANSRVGSLTNSGHIEGGTYAVYVAPNSGATLTRIDIMGNDTAAFRGDVRASDSDVSVKSGAVFSSSNAFMVRSFNVENGALLNLRNSPSTSAMADGISVSNGLHNSGTLALASGVTGTVQGDYTQTASGTLKIGVADDSSYAKLRVSGVASLPSNARINVDVSDPGYRFSSKSLQDILKAGTLVSDGTFAVTDNSLLFDFGAVKDGNTVDLTLAAAGGSGSAGTGLVEDSVRNLGNSPAFGAARVLDQAFSANPTGELARHFLGLSSTGEVSNAVSQTLPTAAGNAQNATSSTLAGINRVIQARQESNSGLSSGDPVQTEHNLWIKTFGSWAEQDARGGVSGYDANTQGLAIGADAATSEYARLGLAFAYARTDLNNDSHVAPQDMKIDTYQLIGYGSYALAPETELNFQLDGGQNRSKSTRHMPFADATAKGNHDGYNFHAGLGIGHSLHLSEQLTFVPSARADYTWIGSDAYQEKGAGALNLKVDSNASEELLLSVDGKLNYALSQATVVSANLGAGYDVIDDGSAITSSYAGAPGATFHTRGLDLEPWLARAGLGLTHTLDNGSEIGLRYDAELRSGFTNQGASVKARWAF